MAGAAAALYGPLHRRCDEEVLKMLSRIDERAYSGFIHASKRRRQTDGFRASHLQKIMIPARASLSAWRRSIRGDRAQSFARHRAGTRTHRTGRRIFHFAQLTRNVDFYSGIIYQRWVYRRQCFPVMFCHPRTVGWLAAMAGNDHDPEQKITRPRQIFLGQSRRRIAEAEDLARYDVSLNYARLILIHTGLRCLPCSVELRTHLLQPCGHLLQVVLLLLNGRPHSFTVWCSLRNSLSNWHDGVVADRVWLSFFIGSTGGIYFGDFSAIKPNCGVFPRLSCSGT